MLEIGKQYYIIAHAYWHFVGTVREITPRYAVLDRCVQVHACGRPWTAFFAEGFRKDTRYDWWPDGTIVPIGLPCAPFPHPIPKEQK